VQIVTRRGRAVEQVEHVGSARSGAELALLLQLAHERLSPGQQELDLGELAALPPRMEDVADWTTTPAGGDLAAGSGPAGAGGAAAVTGRAGGRVVSTGSELLWRVLCGGYDRLGFDVVGDEAFKAMVLARVVEATSKAGTVRVLAELGAPVVSVRTLFRSLGRCLERDYRGQIARACTARVARAGPLALVMYDVTTLHFEVSDEDGLRKVGLSKEHRVDPQVQVGLLVDAGGFPLEVHLFEGNRAETKTILPVLQAFQARHGVTDLVVVADAGMLSAGNLNAIEDAGFSFIVGSRITRAPYDLADHFVRHGNYFTDGQVLESARIMGSGPAARERRVVYQYSFARDKRDNKTINAQITKAEKVADGTRPLKRERFVTITGADKGVDWSLVERARQLAGLKGYVSNIDPKVMDGAAIIAAYHDLWQVEASFRMTKNDLRARPVFHHQQDAIEAHLTVVFAALAVARDLQARTGLSTRRLVRTLQPLRTATIEINGQRITLDPDIPQATQGLLDRLENGH
jgi:hypothetical protein